MVQQCSHLADVAARFGESGAVCMHAGILGKADLPVPGLGPLVDGGVPRFHCEHLYRFPPVPAVRATRSSMAMTGRPRTCGTSSPPGERRPGGGSEGVTVGAPLESPEGRYRPVGRVIASFSRRNTVEIDAIERRTFPISRRGYDRDEVDAYLATVAAEFRKA